MSSARRPGTSNCGLRFAKGRRRAADESVGLGIGAADSVRPLQVEVGTSAALGLIATTTTPLERSFATTAAFTSTTVQGQGRGRSGRLFAAVPKEGQILKKATLFPMQGNTTRTVVVTLGTKAIMPIKDRF